MAYITKGNKIITEDYVSFETAKLLKEKGFDEATYHDYDTKGRLWFNDVLAQYNQQGTGFACPTLQMVMKWLREKYKLNVEVCLNAQGYEGIITTVFNGAIKITNTIPVSKHNIYEEACEAAIKYCLENLI